MGVHSFDSPYKDRQRVTTTVPAAAGQYADGVLWFGKVGTGQVPPGFCGVTALIESIPALAVVELWLPKAVDTAEASANYDIATDFFYSGLCVVPARVAYTATGETASFGSGSWFLASYPGAALRIKSGGTGGSATISGSAY